MNRKLFAGGLLVAVCMCLLAVDGTSQAPPPPAPMPPAPVVSPPSSPGASFTSDSAPRSPTPSSDASFETLVQELKTVRAQREALNEREKVLLDKIAQKVEEQRKALQKSEELLRQLQSSPPHEGLARPYEKRPLLRSDPDKKLYDKSKEVDKK